jgi:hypothetical protein
MVIPNKKIPALPGFKSVRNNRAMGQWLRVNGLGGVGAGAALAAPHPWEPRAKMRECGFPNTTLITFGC